MNVSADTLSESATPQSRQQDRREATITSRSITPRGHKDKLVIIPGDPEMDRRSHTHPVLDVDDSLPTPQPAR